MPDIQEVYDMVTKQTPPRLDALDTQHHRQDRNRRNRKLGAFAVVTLIALIAVAAIVRADDRVGTTPATVPPSVPLEDPAAVGIARQFLDAYAAFDAEQANSYLAPDASMSGMVTNLGELPLVLSWLQATRYKQFLGECTVTQIDPVAGTDVFCPFRYDNLGSEKFDLGPFGDSYFSVTVRDGKISLLHRSWSSKGFARQMWEPFLHWVKQNHPDDALIMYVTDGTPRLTKESIRLWAQHVAEYDRGSSR